MKPRVRWKAASIQKKDPEHLTGARTCSPHEGGPLGGVTCLFQSERPTLSSPLLSPAPE